MASNFLVHPEHVDASLLEYSLHLLVAQDLALVLGILKIVGLDVLPELLDDLRARELYTSQSATGVLMASPCPGSNQLPS